MHDDACITNMSPPSGHLCHRLVSAERCPSTAGRCIDVWLAPSIRPSLPAHA